MADNRYGGYGRYGRGDDWRSRGSSIFSEDDGDRFGRGGGRWAPDHGRQQGEERGFFERAGDEVRSWFGDDEAERRRERDYRSNQAQERHGAFDPGERGAFFGNGTGSRRFFWDDNYQQWRAQQIAALDRDYEDYCRERQQAFDREFDTWRTGRQQSASMTGTSTATNAAGTGQATEPGTGSTSLARTRTRT